MSNKNPANKFKKGNKGGGRKPLPKDLREAINQGKEQLCRDVLRIRSLTLDEAKQYKDDKKLVSKLTIAEYAMINAYIKCDYQAIKQFEDRIFGKAAETHALTNPEGGDLFKDAIKSVNEMFKQIHGKDSEKVNSDLD
jgi:hypothetical protein